MGRRAKGKAVQETSANAVKAVVLVGLEDAAKQLNMSLGGMRTWVVRRQIDIVKIGRRTMIEQTTIDEIIERGRRKAVVPVRPTPAWRARAS